jgi:ATP-dependent helicase/nuclease subunit A
MPKQLTPSQEKALDDSRHLAITANAGSGKTTVLVERYVKLFENHEDLLTRNVVAITFTDAAAAELRKKIAKEIRERLTDPTLSPAVRAQLERTRDGLQNAYISTIHSFARRLIAAFPVEANVDAAFVTLPPSEKTLLLEETISRIFQKVLREAYKTLDANPDGVPDPMLATFRRLTRREVEAILQRMFNSRTRTRKLRECVGQHSDMQILLQWRDAIESELKPVLDGQLEDFSFLLSIFKKKSAARDKATTQLPVLASAKEFFQRVREYALTYKALFTGEDTIRKDLLKEVENLSTAAEIEIRVAKAHKDIKKIIEKCVDEASFVREHAEYLQILRNVLSLYSQVEQAYTEAKTNYGMLDFDDQIDRLHDLVKQPTIKFELASQFRYILIDEYQDTDDTQFDIAKNLTLDFGTTNKLAIVGDPKQSIYGFRNADVRVFNETTRCIAAQRLDDHTADIARSLDLVGQEVHGILTLAESFRTADRPLAYINHAFAKLMKVDENDADAMSYVPLIAARPGKVEGSVEWLVPTDTMDGDEDGDAVEEEPDTATSLEEGHIGNDEAEAELIARRILSIIGPTNTQYHIHEQSKESPEIVARNPELGDIAILLRNRTHVLGALEQVFIRHRIPYSVQRGVGFFNQQEIIDLLSYLNFLLNQNDDVSLLGVLRSPLFALSDTEIYQIHVHATDSDSHRSVTFWEQLQMFAEVHAIEHPGIWRAIVQLRENLSLSGRVNCSVLLEKIVNETGIIATYSALTGGEQVIANIDKFLSMARTHDSRGLATLYDFVARVNDLVSREEQEPQAQTSTGNNVQIMTTHGAKGLEFPIVIVAGLGVPFNLTNRYTIDPQFGILFNKSSAPKPAITAMMSEASTKRMLDEEKRILYVALTRAKDHLILSGRKPTGKSKNKPSPLKWFEETVHETVLEDREDGLGVVEEFERYDATTLSTTPDLQTFTVPVTHSLPESGVELRPTNDEPELPPMLKLQQYEATIGLGRFSPSQLLTYIECPTKYYLRYILGMPEDSRLVMDQEPDDLAESVRNEFAEQPKTSGSVDGTTSPGGILLGQILHTLFERIDRLAHDGVLKLELFDQQFGSICAALGVNDPAVRGSYRGRALADLSTFLDSPLSKMALGSPVVKTEFQVHAALSKANHLRGILDRFFITASGEAHILDYKTDWTTGIQDNKKSDRYRFQVKFYAYMLSLLYPEQKRITATLYYTRTGETEQYVFGHDDLRATLSELDRLIGEVRSLEKIKSLHEIAKHLDHCRECAYFEVDEGKCVVTVAEFESTRPIAALI